MLCRIPSDDRMRDIPLRDGRNAGRQVNGSQSAISYGLITTCRSCNILLYLLPSTCPPSFSPILSRVRAFIFLSLGWGMCPAPTLYTHIALFHLHCTYTWYYTHNATFYYIYFRQPVDQHSPRPTIPSSVSAVIWQSLGWGMCPAPTLYTISHFFHRYFS